MRRLIACLCLAALACGGGAAAERTFHTYPLLVSDADAIIELLEDAVGDDGRIIHDRANSRLLVSATPEAHARIRELLPRINVPGRNVRIDVTIEDASKRTESAAGIEGSGHVVVGPDDTDFKVRVTPHLQHRTTSATDATRQTLLVMSGAEAVLRVGKDVPFEEWIVEYGRHCGYIEKHTVLQSVGARLRVSPRIVGDSDLIHVSVTPELSALVGGHRREIRYTGVSTAVTVRDGQTVSLGGTDQHKDFYDRFLVGVSKSGTQRRLDIRLTPHIVEPARPAEPPSLPEASPPQRAPSP